LAAITNHQDQVEWEPYAAIGSAERLERLKQLLADRADASGAVAACLWPLAVRHPFPRGLRDPVHRGVPARRECGALSLDTFAPGSIQIRLGAP
jgi:hypothetical protein